MSRKVTKAYYNSKVSLLKDFGVCDKYINDHLVGATETELDRKARAIIDVALTTPMKVKCIENFEEEGDDLLCFDI